MEIVGATGQNCRSHIMEIVRATAWLVCER